MPQPHIVRSATDTVTSTGRGWLFGHVGSQRRPKFGENDNEDVKLNPTHEAVVIAGLPLLWLNPLLGLVATATKDLWFDRRRFIVPADDRAGYTRIESLDAFRVTVDGLWSDDTRGFARNADEFGTLQRFAREKDAREEAEAKERTRLGAEVKANAQALWGRSVRHATLLTDFSGVWPEFLDVMVPLDASVPHGQWQAQLFSNRTALADDTGRLRVKACIDVLPGVFQSERNAGVAIDIWFQALVAYRHLTRKPVFGGGSADYRYLLSSPADYDAKMRARYPAMARNNPAALGLTPEAPGRLASHRTGGSRHRPSCAQPRAQHAGCRSTTRKSSASRIDPPTPWRIKTRFPSRATDLAGQRAWRRARVPSWLKCAALRGREQELYVVPCPACREFTL